MFERGDTVTTDEATPRTGTVRTQLASGEYQVCFDAADQDCALFADVQLTRVKEEPTDAIGGDEPEAVPGEAALPILTLTAISPEDEATQQAKQKADLAPEELAYLEEEHQAHLAKQAEREAKRSTLSLESLAEQFDALDVRVTALETPGSVPPAPAENASSVYAPEHAPVLVRDEVPEESPLRVSEEA